MRKILLIAAVAFVPQAAFAQKMAAVSYNKVTAKLEGQWVTVVVRKAELQDGTRVLGTISHGEQKGQSVWISRANVLPFEAIRLDPNDSDNYTARSAVWYFEEELDKAIAEYDMTIRLDPNDGMTYLAPRIALYEKVDLDKAIADYDKSFRLDPTTVFVPINRGSAWQDKGEYEKALADFEEAIRLDSMSSEALNSRAWIRATCPSEKYRDGTKALEDATKACELTDWKDPFSLDTLAAAYAEAGQFDNAVEWQQKAIDLAPESEKADFGTRLVLYQAKKPYRE